MEFYPHYLRANYVGKGESYVCRLRSDKCRVVGIFTGRDITAEYNVPEEDAEEAAEWRSCDVFVEQAHHDYQQMMTEKLQVRTPQHYNPQFSLLGTVAFGCTFLSRSIGGIA